MLDASLYSAAALYGGVLKVPVLLRVDHCSLLWQQELWALFPSLLVVGLPLTYRGGKMLAVGRQVRYALSGQQVVWLNVGMASVPEELLVFPGVELD